MTVTDERQALEDVTLVVLARDADAEHLAAWLSSIKAGGPLEGASLIVWHEQDVAGISEGLADDHDVEWVTIDGDRDQPSAQAVASLLLHVKTKYFTVISASPSRRTRRRDLRKRLINGLELVATSGVQDERPLLLNIGTYPRPLLAAYLSHMLRFSDHGNILTTDYLGFLALQSAAGVVEAIDPQDSAMSIFARLNFGPLEVGSAPPWAFTVSLVGPGGSRIRSDAGTLSQRVNMYGGARWEYINVTVPVATAATGEYRVVVSLASKSEDLTKHRELRPNVGTLLNARTVELPVAQQTGASMLRYLVHATGNSKVTRVTVAQGGGRGAAQKWSRILLKKDLSFLMKRGGPRQMRLLRLARLVTSPILARHRPWLIGEREGTAQDNGFHLFRYLRTERQDINAYYVMDKSSSQYERVKRLGRVVEHSSLRHKLLMLHAAVLANAYSINYLIPRQWDRTQYARHLAWRTGAQRVYLKHGVHMSPNALKRGSTGYDMILTVAPRETSTLAAASGYGDQLTEVGLPRYDALVPTPPSRTILFMSTWRRYLVPKVFGGENKDLSPFEGSVYEQFMTEFLGSPRLQELLERHDYRLVFLPHHNLADRVQQFPVAGERVSIADANVTSFQDLIRECDAFITDHSSVSFDIAYLGTPMIYSRFDREEFERRHAAPSWFDHERDGFGPVAYDLEDTLDELDRLLNRGCVADDFYMRRIEDTFTHRDQHNCRRVTRAIESQVDAAVAVSVNDGERNRVL